MYITFRLLVLYITIKIKNPHMGCFTGLYPTGGNDNTTEAVASILELRWPNKGYYGVQGKRKATYDEVNIPEWAVGQLTNIYHMQNPDTKKKSVTTNHSGIKGRDVPLMASSQSSLRYVHA